MDNGDYELEIRQKISDLRVGIIDSLDSIRKDMDNEIRDKINVDEIQSKIDEFKRERLLYEQKIRTTNDGIAEMENGTFNFPHIMCNDYIEYYLFIEQKIEKITRNNITYDIPLNKQKYTVYGTITITTPLGSDKIINISGHLNNYIHQCGNLLCIGNLKSNNMSNDLMVHIKTQASMANLDSPFNSEYPYRPLMLLWRKLNKDPTVEATGNGSWNL